MFSFTRAYTAISLSAQQLGFAAAFAPDTKKASKAAEKIFAVLKREVQLQPKQGAFPDENFTGKVDFKHVNFCYPTRKKIQVLKVGFIY